MTRSRIEMDKDSPYVIEVRSQSPDAFDAGFNAYWHAIKENITEDPNPYPFYSWAWCSFCDGWFHASELDNERNEREGIQPPPI